MAKRISEESRVENYFRTADEMTARGTLRVAAAIMEVRFPTAKVERAKPGRKAKSKPPAVETAAASS